MKKGPKIDLMKPLKSLLRRMSIRYFCPMSGNRYSLFLKSFFREALMRHRVIDITIVVAYLFYLLSAIHPVSNINNQIATMCYQDTAVFHLAQRAIIHESRVWIALPSTLPGVVVPMQHKLQSLNFPRKYAGDYPSGFV